MTRLIRGSVLLAACVGLWSCGSDSTSSEAGVPYKIVSLPSVVFVKTDSSQLITFQLVDEIDGQIPSTWTLTSSSPNFTVALDSSYRPVYNSDGTLTLPDSQTEVRATIRGTNLLGISNFTVSAGGKTLTIPVNVVPGTIYATFSPSNPAPGEVVTMTLPPTLRFTPASRIGFPGNQFSATDTTSIRNLVIAADSMSATFIAAPTVDTVARVTNVWNAEFPTLAPVTLSSQTKVTGTQAAAWTGKLPAVLSPLVAGTMTATLDPAFAYKCDPTCANALPSVFSFPGQTAPIVTVSADSTVATLQIGPNVASPLQVTRVTFKGAPMFEYNLVSADSVISGIVSTMPVTYSNASPAFQGDVVVTGDAGFTFTPTAQLVLAGKNLPVVARAGGGTSITVRNLPGGPGSGIPTVVGAVSPSAPAFGLTIPADDALTLGQMVLATSGNTLVVPDTGVMQSSTLGYPSRVYTTTLAGTTTVQLTVTWAGAFDLGLYILDAGGNIVGSADNLGSSGGGGGNGQPEVSGPIVLPAGTYTFAMLRFGASPPNYTMSIATQ